MLNLCHLVVVTQTVIVIDVRSIYVMSEMNLSENSQKAFLLNGPPRGNAQTGGEIGLWYTFRFGAEEARNSPATAG